MLTFYVEDSRTVISPSFTIFQEDFLNYQLSEAFMNIFFKMAAILYKMLPKHNSLQWQFV